MGEYLNYVIQRYKGEQHKGKIVPSELKGWGCWLELITYKWTQYANTNEQGQMKRTDLDFKDHVIIIVHRLISYE